MGPGTTLADIDVRIRVFRDALPKCGFNAACKAIARIAQAADRPLAAVPAAEALARYEALTDVPPSVVRDEGLYLGRALALPALPEGCSRRIRCGEPTLADAIVATDAHAAALEQAGRADQSRAWRSEAGRIKGALEQFAKKVASRPESTAATLSAINTELCKRTHTDFAYTKESFVSFCSRIRRAVRLVDINARRKLTASLLSGPWKAIVDAANRKAAEIGGALAKLWPLIEYCERHEIAPAAVDDAVIAALQADLARHGRKNSFGVAREVIYAWEALQRVVPGFPAQKLQRIYQDAPLPNWVAYDDLPPAFRESCEDFFASYFRETQDKYQGSLADFVVNPGETLRDAARSRARRTPLKQNPSSKDNFKSIVTCAANVAYQHEIAFETLTDLINGDICFGVLSELRNRQQARAARNGAAYDLKSNYRKNAASIFIAIARHLKVDPEETDRMIDYQDDVDPRIISSEIDENGERKRTWTDKRIGPRHAERVRAFNDPTKLLAWYDLPDLLRDRVLIRIEAKEELNLEECNDLAVAAIHQVMRCCPARRKNIAQFRFQGATANMKLPARKGAEGSIHIDWREVKNKKNLSAILTVEAVEVIDLWIQYARPVVMKALGSAPDNPYLFPGPGHSHRDPAHLNKIFVGRNLDDGGFLLNMHCQRHLSAKLILDADPSLMELVQVLLGHKKIETTKAYYAEVNELLVQRLFQELVKRRIEELRGLPLKKRA